MLYPEIARIARLQGRISLRLRISSAGAVLDAQANATDTLLKEHPLLQRETARAVRRWTFECANCPPEAEYAHVVTFVYRLEGPEAQHSTSHFTLDSPEHVTVTTNPPQVNW